MNGYEGGHSNNFNCECNWLDYKYDKLFFKKRHYMKNEKKKQKFAKFPENKFVSNFPTNTLHRHLCKCRVIRFLLAHYAGFIIQF